MKRGSLPLSKLSTALLLLGVVSVIGLQLKGDDDNNGKDTTAANALAKVTKGRQVFRFDTFGDEAFWGGTLGLHKAIEGSTFAGGVGPGVSPKTALAVGLKVDIDALPSNVREQLLHGMINLDSPASTLALLKLNAVVGVTGFFNSNGSLSSIGIQCALCHSTVDNSMPALCAGQIVPNPNTGCIGHRLDGWPNRDLNVGKIISLAPDLTAFVNLLSFVHPGITQDQVRAVLNTWGPGKFDAELILDGKTTNTIQQTDGGPLTTVSGATLIPPAFGLGGVNLHTWTGWGSVPHWNAFVANLEMHGVGRFFDSRLNNAAQFPIAAHFGLGNLNPNLDPDSDRITKNLPSLQFYQLAIPSPPPPAGSFDKAAADRGDALFSGAAGCNHCHVEPLWSDPGWNMHDPSEVCIDSFQANRAPDLKYRTSPIGALFTHLKGGFYHDGRFPTLNAVVDHYNTCMHLGLSQPQKNDLVQYLLSLTFVQ